MRKFLGRIILVLIAVGLVAGACVVRSRPGSRGHYSKPQKHAKHKEQKKHKKHK